jgi:hypothetical protein
MKTFVLTILLFIGSIQIFAVKQPEVVAKAFKQKFPSALNIKWVKDRDNLWNVSFKLNNKKTSASFSSDGHWIWGEIEKPINELRDEVKDAIKRDYPRCEIISIYLREWVGMGSWYKVKVKCGNSISEASYDEHGWPPPKI